MKRKIIIVWKVYEIVELYTRRYRLYYQELFEDSGIWNSKQIIEGYKKESILRYTEILDTLESTLSNPLISYQNNTTIIRWRSKILLVSFRDEWEVRIITDLEIR